MRANGKIGMDTNFILVRHGQTAENINGLLQGHYDSVLDDTGILQARSIAERLRGEAFDAIYSSDLTRALQTAKMIAAELGMEVTAVKELREWHLGKLENRPYDELWNEFFPIMDACKHNTSKNLTVPGGESKYVFEDRIVTFLESLALQWKGKKLLVVTHGGSLRAIFRHVCGFQENGRIVPLSSNVRVDSLSGVLAGGIVEAGLTILRDAGGAGKELRGTALASATAAGKSAGKMIADMESGLLKARTGLETTFPKVSTVPAPIAPPEKKRSAS